MKSHRADSVDTRVASGPIAELSLAVRAGRLVALLRGDGLSRTTVEELVRPESLPALRAILTARLEPQDDPAHGACASFRTGER